MPVAAPTVSSRGWHHICTDGVEFNVAHTGEQIGFYLYQAGFVSPFPQAAGAAVAAVNVLHVTPTNCLHEFGCAVLAFRCGYQVDVVGYE